MKVSIVHSLPFLLFFSNSGVSDSKDSPPQDQHDNIDDEKSQNHVRLSHTRRRIRLAGFAGAFSSVAGLHRTLVWRRPHTPKMGALERTLHTQVSRYLLQTIPRRQSTFRSLTHSDLFNLPLPALWTVVLGENNRKVESGFEQRIPVDKIIMHEKYRHFKNDLGESSQLPFLSGE
jgi:hypothetical protein